MKEVDFCRRILRRAGVKLRGVWENWSRRKKVTVSVCAVIGALVLGAAIFCLTVPLFYWWPDGVPIPGTNGTMMFVKESDPNREYRVNYAANYPSFQFELTADDVLTHCGASQLYEWNRSVVEVEKIRLIDRLTDEGWAAEAVVQVRVDYVVLNASLKDVRSGDKFLVYCGDRYDHQTQKKPDERLWVGKIPQPCLRGAQVEENASWYISLFHHDTMPVICRTYRKDIDVMRLTAVSSSTLVDYVVIDNDYADYEYWTPYMSLVSDYYSFPTANMRRPGGLQVNEGYIEIYEGVRKRVMDIEIDWIERLKKQ